MNVYKESKEKVLDEILDNRTLSDPSSLYDNTIESLKELNVSESIAAVLADIDIINKENRLLNTSIIRDRYHQIKIKDYFKQQALHITPIPELINQKPDEILGELFYGDFSRIFEDARIKYIKKNHLYNTSLSQKHLLEGDEEYREKSYVLCCPYQLNNNIQLNIFVEYTYDSDSFHVYTELYHPEIDWNPQTIKEGSFENKFQIEYLKNFDFSQFNSPKSLTKENLTACANNILTQINKHNLDNNKILRVYKKNSKSNDDLMITFLKNRLSKSGIERTFFPLDKGKKIKDHTPQHNRALYNFETAFIALIMDDMSGRLPYLEFTPKLNKINIATPKDSFVNAEYSLEMVNDTLTLSSDGFFVCKWEIHQNIGFKTDIIDYIQADLQRTLSKQAQHNHSVENTLKTALMTFFDNDLIHIEIPQLHTLNMENFMNKIIPVKITFKSDTIDMSVSFSEEFDSNEQLTALKEKARISKILDSSALTKKTLINRI